MFAVPIYHAEPTRADVKGILIFAIAASADMC
jgi:hypothetical protein